MSSIIVLSGNPRAGSRTTAAAERLAALISEVTGAAPVSTIELADSAGTVLEYGNAEVAGLRARLTGARLVIVATPSYKGSYTGLLKGFFDGYGPTSLAGVATVPLVVAGSPQHTTLTAEIHLRPLMHEVGASTPLGTIAITEAELADAASLDETLREWVSARLPLLAVVVSPEGGVLA